MDHYQILGVSKQATPDQIKKAYKKKSFQCHPDKNQSPEAVVMFQQVQTAYRVLSDSNMKYAYDNLGAAELERRQAAENAPPAPGFWSSWFAPKYKAPEISEPAQLTINLGDRTFNVSANLLDMVQNVKCTLAFKSGVKANEILLFFNGTELKDDRKNLKHYRVQTVANLDAIRKID